MKSASRALIIFPFFILIFSGCKKEAGEGGGAIIEGKLYAKNFHSPGIPYGTDDFVAGKKMYITYGDKTIADDDIETGYDGSFKFSYLRKGTYNIFTYSLDTTSFSDDHEITVIKTVEITENNQELTLDDFLIYEEADNGGSSVIRGKIYEKKYASSFTLIIDEYYKADEDVFVIFGRDKGVSKRIKTSYDGSFEIKNLRKGNYQIYALSSDTTMQTSAKVNVLKEVEITQNNQVIEIPDIIIAK